jgi:hypothetical protein
MNQQIYRVRQFFQSLWLKSSPTDLQIAYTYLPDSLIPLFMSMSPADQSHSLRVCEALLDQGHEDPDLLAAALLHDVGKSLEPPTVWERVLAVLANQIAPHRVLNWSEAEARGWRKPFVIANKHPDWGADLVAKHGGSETLIQLIRYHQVEPESLQDDRLIAQLSLLQAADSAN